MREYEASRSRGFVAIIKVAILVWCHDAAYLIGLSRDTPRLSQFLKQIFKSSEVRLLFAVTRSRPDEHWRKKIKIKGVSKSDFKKVHELNYIMFTS